MPDLKIQIAQINTVVGDIAGNVEKIIAHWSHADHQDAQLVVTSELSVSGYPLEDFIENPDLLHAVETGLKKLILESKKMRSAILVGAPVKGAQHEDGRNVYNAAFLIESGEIKHVVHKQHLPTYDVFDEKRNNAPGMASQPYDFHGMKLGILICEDTWFPDVSKGLADKGAQILLSMNASPFEEGKYERRLENVVRRRASETNLPVIYVNQLGGQDEVVFDGASMAVAGDGKLIYQAPAFEEHSGCIEVSSIPFMPASISTKMPQSGYPDRMERIWRALVLGTRDYLYKSFGPDKEVVIGMSGGIDSALVAAIASDAIGADKVHLVSMPYRYTSDATRNDARIAAEEMLGAPFEEIPIADAVEGLQKTLGTHFNAQTNTVANENDQARVRGNILMHISNEKHWLLLTTGNKSEVSVGYCTLYGDMNGGFNPLKDVYKTTVFELAAWRNNNIPRGLLGPKGPVMPETIITRPPSAELAPGQLDTNSLPPYGVLDAILQAYIEGNKSVNDIAEQTGCDFELVTSVVQKVDCAEFKRRQACPGVKITPTSFGRGRRMPIARPTIVAMCRTVGLAY